MANYTVRMLAPAEPAQLQEQMLQLLGALSLALGTDNRVRSTRVLRRVLGNGGLVVLEADVVLPAGRTVFQELVLGWRSEFRDWYERWRELAPDGQPPRVEVYERADTE